MDQHLAPLPDRILHIKNPNAPQFRFEWHPGKKNVYMIRLGRTPLVGEVVAFGIETHGGAINAVMIFMRGYNERRLEGALPDFKGENLQTRLAASH